MLDQVHLSPVKASVQLRPNFHYFDAAVVAEKKKKGQGEDTAIRQPRAIHVTPLKNQVNFVQTQMRNADDPRDSRRSGQQGVAYEEFIPLQWVDTTVSLFCN
jgi:RPC5 protein